jgi:hypothetical protein
MKNTAKLKDIIEWVAKMSYKNSIRMNQMKHGTTEKEKSNAEATSLWYLLINKKDRLIKLYQKELHLGGDKVAKLLSKDFNEPKVAKTAKS